MCHYHYFWKYQEQRSHREFQPATSVLQCNLKLIYQHKGSEARPRRERGGNKVGSCLPRIRRGTPLQEGEREINSVRPADLESTEWCKNLPARFREWLAGKLRHSAILEWAAEHFESGSQNLAGMFLHNSVLPLRSGDSIFSSRPPNLPPPPGNLHLKAATATSSLWWIGEREGSRASRTGHTPRRSNGKI